MKIFTNHIIQNIIFTGCIALSGTTVCAQEVPGKYTAADNDHFDIQTASFLLPQAHPSWHYYHAFTFSYVEIPTAWALQRINAPMITYSARFSLPRGFDVQASLASIYVSNRLNFGPAWNYSVQNFHFGIAYQFAYDFGKLNQSGYRTKFAGWEQQPSFTAGYSFKKSAIILRADLYQTKSIEFVEGGHSVPMWNSFNNGYSVSATLEQRLYRNKVISVGVKLNNIRYHFLAWPAFPVNQNRYFVPEFQIGIKL